MMTARRILLLALAVFIVVPQVTKAAETVSFEHKGMRIIGRDLPPEIYFDIDVVSAQEGADAVRDAIDLLYEQSAYNRHAIEKLKKAGNVVVLYDPQFPKRELNKVTIAAYLPDYYDPGGNSRDFVVVVGRFGGKWSAKELAPVMAHELTGHGMQDLRGRIEHVREIDLECEAYLYQENAYQDLGFNKDTREMIAFRRKLEEHWCADFKTWLRKNRPKALRHWEKLNPDVPKILDDYLAYIDALRTSGVSGRAVANARKETKVQTQARLKALADSTNPEKHFELAMIYQRGIGVSADEAKAVQWFTKAAQGGHAGSQFRLSRAYAKGEGVARDIPTAAKWAKAAAEQGHAPAAFNYGAMLYNGDGIPRDRDAAIKWIRKSAEAGFKLAVDTLSKLGIDKAQK